MINKKRQARLDKVTQSGTYSKRQLDINKEADRYCQTYQYQLLNQNHHYQSLRLRLTINIRNGDRIQG